MELISNICDGRYLKVTVEQGYINHPYPRSSLNYTLSSEGGNKDFYDIAKTKLIIDGQEVYSKIATSNILKEFPAATGSISGNLWVDHGYNGKKTVEIELITKVGSLLSPESYKTTMELEPADVTTPITALSVVSATDTSVVLAIDTSDDCDQLKWQYRKANTSSSWNTFQTDVVETIDKHAECEITGLEKNTEYSFRVNARKILNWKSKYSNTVIQTTYDSTEPKENGVYVDEGDCAFNFDANVYNSRFLHDIVIKYQNLEFSFFDVSLSASIELNRMILNSSQCAQVYGIMTDRKSDYGIVEVTTYLDSEEKKQIGETKSAKFWFYTSAQNSAPTFEGFDYFDASETALSLTKNEKTFIQGVSELSISCIPATPKNGANISSYSAVAGSTAKTSTENEFSLGIIEASNTVPVVVTAIDSRGYTSTATVNINVIPYEKLDITHVDIQRKNNVEAFTTVEINCDITPVIVNGEDKNSLKSLLYRYKKTSDSDWSDYQEITSLVKREQNKLILDIDEWIREQDKAPEFDPDFSYNIQFVFTDQLSQDRESISIPQAIPLMSLRKKKVGINNPNPQSALDVLGDIVMNNHNVLGYVRRLTSEEHLDDITESGVYVSNGFTDKGYPTESAGTLLVIRAANYVTQFYWRYKDVAQIFFRKATVNTSDIATWTGWRSITSTTI